MNNKIEMHIAIHEPTGKLIGIDKADKGKNCQCHCVSCKGELVAKQGETNQWHFAHYHNSKKECDYSFWVVCRDLAKQIFLSKGTQPNTIRLSNEIGPIQVYDITTNDTKRDDLTFDLSFMTKEYGRVFVYLLTPEQNRQHFDETVSFSENVLLIKLQGIEHKKEKVTEELQSIIVEGFNVKKFLDKSKVFDEVVTTPSHNFAPKISLFEVLGKEDELAQKASEIEKNTPDISNYNAEEFICLLTNPKFEMNIEKFTQKDFNCIRSLASVFLGFFTFYGYDSNKHFSFKEIVNNSKVFFASFYNTFVGYVMLDVKFVLFIPKNKTLIPIFSTPFQDNVARKIKPNMFK